MSDCGESYKDFGAGQDTTIDDVEAVTLFTLDDDGVTCLLFDAEHGVQDDAQLRWVQTAEHESLAQAFLQGLSHSWGLVMLGRMELGFLVPSSEDLSGD